MRFRAEDLQLPRLAASPDPPDPGLVRVFDRIPAVPTGNGWWQLVPIWDPAQTPNSMRRWAPSVPYWASDPD
jgi:hypothetical protein